MRIVYTEEINLKLTPTQAVNFCDFGLGNVFLDTTPKVQATKDKIDKLGL